MFVEVDLWVDIYGLGCGLMFVGMGMFVGAYL